MKRMSTDRSLARTRSGDLERIGHGLRAPDPIIKAPVERDRRELQELVDEINPPDFDAVQNADQARQRGEFRPTPPGPGAPWRTRTGSSRNGRPPRPR
jgi:hypothetical protein